MVMYGEQFVYERVNLTTRQQRLVEARELAGWRQWQRAADGPPGQGLG